jgi:hypothetical protein
LKIENSNSCFFKTTVFEKPYTKESSQQILVVPEYVKSHFNFARKKFLFFLFLSIRAEFKEKRSEIHHAVEFLWPSYVNVVEVISFSWSVE